MLHIPRRRLLLGAGAFAAYAALSKEAAPFWQSRDSNYNLSVGGAAPTPIAFVDGIATASSNATDVTSAAINSTGANFLVAAIADWGAGTLGSVTDSKGNTWNALTPQPASGAQARIHLFWSKPSSVGAAHTASYTGTQPSIGFAAFSNVNASPFDNEVGTTGASFAPAGGSITPSANGGLIIAAMAGLFTASPPATVDSSFVIVGTPLSVSGNNAGLGMAYLIETTAAAKNPTWTIDTANPWAATNAAFKN